MNKRKIINDPIYGFINIPKEIIFDIIEHPYFQRLRRIKQLGLTDYVYPGATHTRFEHVLGATHLMNNALKELRAKKHKIKKKEANGALYAILMHDLGHGPFSHTLEHSLVNGISHEEISILFMQALNNDLGGELSLGIEIFKNNYEKQFLHRLVSSQLDMDRLDYLKRDSFFTGVSEGVVGSDRIIKMLEIVDDDLAVEEKGIYSIEKFLIARRLMYWQVYLHKTVVSAEMMLVKAIERARYLTKQNGVYATTALGYFLQNNFNGITDFTDKKYLPSPLEMFAKLDDTDIILSLKEWMNHSDKILSTLSKRLINRNLFRFEISSKPFSEKEVNKIKEKASDLFKLSESEVDYLVFTNTISNKAYSSNIKHKINILHKNGRTSDIAVASDISNISALSETVEKYYLCYPKECTLTE